jgi:eukaryotic-like serine/threonine-protein kinase
MDTGSLIGQSIDDRYRIDAVIGKGGMGTVYRATRLLIGDEVAIKVLHNGQEDSQAAERFRREAQAAARLKHPNAVSIYDFGVSKDGLQYLVMDLVEGKSLRTIAKEQGPLSLPLVAEIASQVCAALDEAHRNHIVHRDIKPDNIVLNSTSAGVRVKVLDFGIAKLRDDSATTLTQTGNVMGTPHYMSPEQCLGEDLDSRADIYSFGIVVYEMLCGRVPFNSPISTAVVVQHVNQAPPSLQSFNAAIPASVEAVVFRALEKAREMRPETAGRFARELKEVISRLAAPTVVNDGASHRIMAASSLDLNEETVEKHNNLPAGAMMPETIYLPLPGSGAVKTTSGTPTALTANVTRPWIHRYRLPIVAAAGITVLFALSFLIWFQRDKPLKTPSALSSPAETVAVNNPPIPNSGGGTISNPKTESMVQVVGGQFQMGSSDGDAESQPAHMVVVKNFYLDVYEVTCREYKAFVEATNRKPPPMWKNGNYPPGTDRYPVTGVSWEDADAYARWAGKRLPTEEEWEFAARGKEGLRYPWGNSWKSECANADNVQKGITNVGSYKCASPFGVQDLVGNAWEWTATPWLPYPNGHLTNPPHPSDKVIRGGSWESPRAFVSTTVRSGWRGIGDQTGFRCAMDIQ